MAQLVKNPPAMWETLGLIPGLGTPIFWPRECHGQRSLTGYSPLGSKELDTTERLSLSHAVVESIPAKEHPLIAESIV